MSIRRKAAVAVLSLVAAGGLGLSVACGNTAEEDPTPVTTPPITPAGPRTVVATTTSAATPASTAAAAETPSGEATTVTLVAKNIKFNEDKLEAKAGKVTVVVDNQDTGVPHNVHVYKGKDAKGDSIGSTELSNGPKKEEVTLDLPADDYFYVCDAHPNMKGTLTVS